MTFALPIPPSDTERDSYLHSQRRWLPTAGFIGYLLIVISLVYFISRHHWTFILFVPLLISAISTLLSLITVSRKRRIDHEYHRSVVDAWIPKRLPTVDIFLPSAGEDIEIIQNTFTYVSRVHWQAQVSVYVMDDSGREDVRRAAEQFGFTYFSRRDRGFLKKAGNLDYTYEYSDGDYISILDADFVPRQDYLYELIPYFDDPTVGIVQSPQFFDIEREMNWVQRAAGATQILFYRFVQPGRDASRAAICVGTSAIYRRAALRRAGGFAQISHSEDVHTGVALMNAGYQIRYVPTVVTKGVCPDKLSAFVTQQYRWCAGSMALLLSGVFSKAKMTPMQRMCYWSGFTYYLSTGLDLIMNVTPTLLMLYLFAGHVRVENYVFVMTAILVRQILVPFITNGSESLIGLSRIQMAYSFAHLVRLWDLVRRHEDESGWVATGSARATPTAQRILRTARWGIGSFQLVLWAGIAWRVSEFGIERFLPIIAFGLFNLFVGLPILLNSETLPKGLRMIRTAVETGNIRRAISA